MIIALIILQLLDILSTYLVLKDGKGHETNKIIAPLIERLGILKGLIVIKLVVAVPLWYLAVYPSSQGFRNLLGILLALYCITVLNNFNEYRKQK